jgi:hypothetical protein
MKAPKVSLFLYGPARSLICQFSGADLAAVDCDVQNEHHFPAILAVEFVHEQIPRMGLGYGILATYPRKDPPVCRLIQLTDITP